MTLWKVIKAITVWEPHASLLVLGRKPYETRSWRTYYRGPIAIHAGYNTSDLALAYREPYKSALTGHQMYPGCILGVCELVDCIPAETAHNQTFGDFTAGRWAWKMEVITLFDEPIPVKGKMGLWDWEWLKL